MLNIKNETLELIKELIVQYSVFVERCNEYIFSRTWYDNGDESSEDEAEEMWQKEAKFQQEVISARDNTVYFLASHRKLLEEYEKSVLEGASFQEDKYLQEEFVKQYKIHVKRLKEHLKNVDFNKDYKNNPTARFLEGRFQIKMINSIDDMLKNLEKSIGIDPTIKTIAKRGGNQLNPFTEEVLLGEGIKPIDQPTSLPYKEWLINVQEPDISNRREYIDFWKKHLSYAITGLTCGGVEISGLLYWQLNFMKIAPATKDEHGNTIATVITPLLRDNEFYIDYNYSRAEKEQKFFFGVGCRRFSKSVFMLAVYTREAYLFKNSQGSFNTLNSKDMQDFGNEFNVFSQNRPSCFADIEKVGDFGKNGTVVEFAIKLSENAQKISYSKIKYLNLSDATSRSENAKTQKGAGGMITKFALEEAGKGNYSTMLGVMKPALSTTDGDLTCSPIIMATGGDTNNSKDLEGDFLNAGERGYFVGKHREYAEYVNGFEFKQLSNRQVGFFVPDVMSIYAGKKKKILFKDYINKSWTKEEIKEVEDMYIYVTDWEVAKKNCQERIEQAFKVSETLGEQEKMYLPSQPEDCFIYRDKNPFNIILSKQKEQYLIDNNLWGESVELSQLANKEIIINPSDKKPYTKFPAERGKNWDAPIQILERPLVKNPPLWCYVAGFDGYRIAGETSTSNSFGSLYIIKCINYEMKIVASYTSRPHQMSVFLEQCRLLLELYNAMCLAEREDLAPLQSHLELKKSIRLLSREINTDKGQESAYRLQGNRPYGQSASSQKSKQYLMSLATSHCNEQNQVFDENGEVIDTVFGIETITDIMLHRELQGYGRGNFDRFFAFSHALMLGDYVVRQRILPRIQDAYEDDYEFKQRVSIPKIKNLSKTISYNSAVPKRRR
jgi:hypothetical protein